MLGSLVRSVARTRMTVKPVLQTIKRSSHDGTWYYRTPPKVDKLDEQLANALFTFMWFWVFYHVITDYQHLTGHYIRPDGTKWTDEELGIPPLDE
ncbi:unnamed protein product [Ixodes pacificus]